MSQDHHDKRDRAVSDADDSDHRGPITDQRCPCCRLCELSDSDEGPRNSDLHDDDREREPQSEPDQTDHDQDAHTDHSGHEEMFKRRFVVCFVLAIPVLIYSPFIQSVFGFTAPTFPGSEFIAPGLGIIIFAYGGIPFLRMASTEVRNREPGMMMLISLAITVAFFWELVTLIVIFLLGHWIEMRSVRRASGALDELAQLMPDTAERITDDGDTEDVRVDDLEADDLILVRPGTSVPADGVVEKGETSVDESMITGESSPVKKEPGEEVIGGTINGDGSLRVRVTATGDDTALAGILGLVEEAQQSRSRTQVLADRAAGWLFYVALGVAAIAAVAWTIAVGFGFPVVERVVTVLVIACPHALGLAVPLVVAINTTMAANNGMLVRDRIAMEEARNLDTVVFDKTGTLTKGEQGVVAVETTADWDADDIVALMAAVEGDSEHMIAQAIREAAHDREVAVPEVHDFEALQGRGVRAIVEGETPIVSAGPDGTDKSEGSDADGETVYVGGPNLLRQLEIEPSEGLMAFADEAGAAGRGVVYLIRNDEAVGAVALADVIREESRQTVDALHTMGVEVAMLTGDSEDVARAVSEDLGIDTYFAEVLPDDKDEKIIELQEQGSLVAMVGDGVNDAPALTRADVGIAIGSGTDVAIESADVVLVENNPLDVVKLVGLSRKSYRKMQENIVWAAGYNVFALPLAAGLLAPIGILLSPAVGAVLMSASTVIVAINAQLLRRADLSV